MVTRSQVSRRRCEMLISKRSVARSSITRTQRSQTRRATRPGNSALNEPCTRRQTGWPEYSEACWFAVTITASTIRPCGSRTARTLMMPSCEASSTAVRRSSREQRGLTKVAMRSPPQGARHGRISRSQLFTVGIETESTMASNGRRSVRTRASRSR